MEQSKEQDKRSLVQRIVDAINDCQPIMKEQLNKHQGYKFRGIDDVYNSVQPLMAKHGFFIMPVKIEKTNDVIANEKNRVTLVHIKVVYKVYGLNGDSIDGEIVGEAFDTSDKATNKALSACYKYFLFQLLCIPTEDLKDADQETIKIENKITQSQLLTLKGLYSKFERQMPQEVYDYDFNRATSLISAMNEKIKKEGK